MMQKWRWIAAFSVAIGGVGGYWYFSAKTSNPVVIAPNTVAPTANHDGDAEASDRFEPLLVDGGNAIRTQSPAAPIDDEPMPRVLLEPGTPQPPRPDVEPGTTLRMPYADEEEGLGLTRYPELRIGSLPARFDLFELIDKANPAEESESKDPTPPADPLPPIPDYHHQHCPYHGGCPAPYYPRAMPRD